MISVDRVTKAVGETRLLDDVTLRVARRECLRIAGSRGSGRSTLLRILATLTAPTSGTVSFDGIDIVRQPAQARRRLAYASPDMLVASRLRVDEYLWMVARSRRAALPDPQVNDLVKRAALDLNDGIDRLSPGQRSSLTLIASLMIRPDILLLDDALHGVQGPERVHLAEAVREARERGSAVVVASDEPDELTMLCGRVVTLEAGRVRQPISPLAGREEAVWAV